MPIGKFIPFDLADLGPRFFARPTGFEMECPSCGRLLLVGAGRRDDKQYNRVSGVVTCPPRNDTRTKPGCGRQFLIGIVAWNLNHSRTKARPRDQRPNAMQLAELRQSVRGVWKKQALSRGEPINTIQELDDDTDEE